MADRASNPLSNVPVLSASSTLQSNQFGSPSKPAMNMDNNSGILSPSPKFREPAQVSKDDTMLGVSPTTPRRPAAPIRNLSLDMPPKELMSMGAASRIPLSPKLDAADTYGSPVIPRRSRGLDFSRAATNLHHSTLADQSSPDSSPTISGRAMNIPGRRRNSQFGGELPTSWASRPGGDRPTVSSSLGSINMMYSGSSSSSSDDDMETDDIDDSILSTPQTASRMPVGLNIWTTQAQATPGWMKNSPGASNFMNFRSTHSNKRHIKPKKHSSSSSSMASPMSRSPPSKDMNMGAFQSQSRRDSISWAANQLHIDGSESEDGPKNTLQNADGLPPTPGRGGIVKRTVTRRSNMLPKTKGFARIKAALAEESAPVETELRREATVIKQTRENDMELEPSRPLQQASLASSPRAMPNILDSLEDPPPFEPIGGQQTADFKTQAQRNSEGNNYWEGMSARTPTFLNRDSTGASDEMSMDPPSLPKSAAGSVGGAGGSLFHLPFSAPSPSSTRATTPVQSADIRTVNNKRRRDDDFDPMSFKRRAVSPGMSTHNSPVAQSPVGVWGKMQGQGQPGGAFAGLGAMGAGPEKGGLERGMGSGNGNGNGVRPNGTKRVGLQGMNDTNDGLMKMSIE